MPSCCAWRVESSHYSNPTIRTISGDDKMSTYDPAAIRRLAESGDTFFRGAARLLDMQDAARVDTTDYDAEWRRAPNARDEWAGYALCGRSRAPRSEPTPHSR